MNIGILVFYKYTGFVLDNINLLLEMQGLNVKIGTNFKLAAPLGLSFYIFQSTTYLGDIRKKKLLPVKNFLKYAAFVSFFPTVVSGPIQKARELIPQLECDSSFEFDNALKGVLFILYGFFEKLVVSNQLAIIVDRVFDDYGNYDGVYYLIAAVCSSLQIYSDFSAYSDIARGTAKLFGINVGKNFDNPYLSTSVAEFWKRWHISLNTWFVEYVYIPLGGSRRGKIRQYINVMIVFLISGAWHGASWHYIFWGGANAVFQLIEAEIYSIKEKFDNKRGREKKQDAVSIVILKRLIVFLLITITLVFFRMPGTMASFYFIKNMLMFYPMTLFNEELILIGGTAAKTFTIAVTAVIFMVFQYFRKEEGKVYRVFVQQPKLVQILAVSIFVYIVFFSWVAGAASINTQFIYFQF